MVKTFNLVQNQTHELPNNIEAEQSVIGSILVSNEIFDEINMIIAIGPPNSDGVYGPRRRIELDKISCEV